MRQRGSTTTKTINSHASLSIREEEKKKKKIYTKR
jgi:hypothetical protein